MVSKIKFFGCKFARVNDDKLITFPLGEQRRTTEVPAISRPNFDNLWKQSPIFSPLIFNKNASLRYFFIARVR